MTTPVEASSVVWRLRRLPRREGTSLAGARLIERRPKAASGSASCRSPLRVARTWSALPNMSSSARQRSGGRTPLQASPHQLQDFRDGFERQSGVTSSVIICSRTAVAGSLVAARLPSRNSVDESGSQPSGVVPFGSTPSRAAAGVGREKVDRPGDYVGHVLSRQRKMARGAGSS